MPQDKKQPDCGNSAVEGWRKYVQVHPYADQFPMLSGAPLNGLVRSIRQDGVKVPMLFGKRDGKWELLDGRNRLEAAWCAHRATRLQVRINDRMVTLSSGGFDVCGIPFVVEKGDPVAAIKRLNIDRRHLDREQRRELLRQALRSNPHLSNRAIARQVGVDDKTAAAARAAMEATADIPRLETTVGDDGKERPAHPAPIAELENAAEPEAAAEPEVEIAAEPEPAAENKTTTAADPEPKQTSDKGQKKSQAAGQGTGNNRKKSNWNDAVAAINAELGKDAGRTLDGLANLLQSNSKKLRKVSEPRRAELLFKIAEALGFGREDIRALLDAASQTGKQHEQQRYRWQSRPLRPDARGVDASL